ncbi:MAG: hypothetical protein U0U67_08265 [Chitinophagales bacterium]
MKKIIVCFSCVLFFFSCESPKKQASFYFWKTTYNIDAAEQLYLDKLNVQKLYVRFFDIDILNGTPKPIGQIQIQQKNKSQQIIPVVFITNETFKDLDKAKIEQLAKNCIRQIEFLYTNISDNKLQEIQFDCDWTTSTRNNYFYFLNQVKKQFPKYQYSCTIRLHQIKDKEQTGVPPLKQGVLMYYATSNPLDFTDKNSILENDIAENYCAVLQNYPITLDIALPIYSWAIIENQVGEKRLLNGIRNEDLKDTSVYQAIKPNFYLVKKDHYLQGNYLYQDFKIKTESISQEQLTRSTTFLRKKIKNKEPNVIFFQLDSSNLMHYSVQNLKSIL